MDSQFPNNARKSCTTSIYLQPIGTAKADRQQSKQAKNFHVFDRNIVFVKHTISRVSLKQ